MSDFEKDMEAAAEEAKAVSTAQHQLSLDTAQAEARVADEQRKATVMRDLKLAMKGLQMAAGAAGALGAIPASAMALITPTLKYLSELLDALDQG